MPLGIVEKALAQIYRNPDVDGVEFLWLTGEPLVLGLDYFRKAVGICRNMSPRGINITFVVQTNGTLIDEDWCNFFLENDFVVGVSLDGPSHIHDAQRIGRDSRGSFGEASRGAELLIEHGVKGGAICVITRATLDFPADDLFHFFFDRGIAWSYLIEASIGENIKSSEALTLDDRPKIESYLSRLLDLWATHPETYIRVFDQTTRRIFGGAQPHQDFNNLGCLDILNVSHDGGFFWGNPELMSATLGPLKSLRFNLSSDDVWECRTRPTFVSYQAEVHRGVSKCQESCAFFEGCQGGNPAHKYYECGSFDVTDHASCMLNDQVIQALMASKLGQKL